MTDTAFVASPEDGPTAQSPCTAAGQSEISVANPSRYEQISSRTISNWGVGLSLKKLKGTQNEMSYLAIDVVTTPT